MNIVVTGAAGFIGSHLAEQLAKLGHRVVGLDSFDGYYARELKDANARTLAAAGVTVVEADLASDDLGAHVAEADVVYHLAAQPGISASTPFAAYLRNNVEATHRLMEAIEQRQGGAPWLVNISTSSVYGADASCPETAEPRPTSFYGVTKLAAEQLVLAAARERGLRACSFRLFSVYGPRERPDKLFSRLASCLHEDTPFPLYEGSEAHERSYTYVADVVDGLAGALGRLDRLHGEIVNLGNDASFRTIDAIRTAEAVAGRPLRIVRHPRRSGDQQRTHANIEKARQLLGFAPHTSLREGIAQHMAWHEQMMAERAPAQATP